MIYFGRYRPELYRCCLCWKDDITLFIGWADMVQVRKVVFVINATNFVNSKAPCTKISVVDKTLTPSQWTAPMDYPYGLP